MVEMIEGMKERMTIATIKEYITANQLEEAENALLLHASEKESDEVFYLLGNVYRKQGNWQKALTCYNSALELNPESPARIAAENLNQILNYYNKDMINP